MTNMVAKAAVIVEAALNGGRDRSEQPAVPFSASELAVEARRCADAGAAIFHVHARGDEGEWTADPARYDALPRALRAAVPGALISIPSIRPETVPVETILDLPSALAHDPATTPDLISINLGHIVAWESIAGGRGRRTVHYPNSYDDIARLLAACVRHGIRPEPGVMDHGFVSNAVALRDDWLLPAHLWFLLELDSPAYGAGPRVAPATAANYDALATAIREHTPDASWRAKSSSPITSRACAITSDALSPVRRCAESPWRSGGTADREIPFLTTHKSSHRPGGWLVLIIRPCGIGFKNE